MIEIITTPDDVLPYLEDVKALADNQKNELGFIPYSAYRESCFNGNLFVATIAEQQGKNRFAGYALLGGRFPTKRIFQLAVFSHYRHRGVGKLLVDAVVESADKDHFWKIAIKVGKKLSANDFWGKLQFDLIDTVKGGQSHPIQNVRIREIIPSLFSSVDLPVQPALQLIASKISSGPTFYLLDTNVILDISNQRSGMEASQNLMRLVDKGDIEVAVAEEVADELERHRQKENDFALKMIEDLQRVPLGNETELIARLRKIIFPTRDEDNQQSTSDIRHIATAIVSHASGFITRDEAILRKQNVLSDEFSLKILAPADFWEEDELQEFNGLTIDVISTEESFKILPALVDEAREKIANTVNSHEIDEKKFNYASLEKNNAIVANCAVEKRLPAGGRPRGAFLFLEDNAGKMAVSTMLDFISRQSMSYTQSSAINLVVYGGGGRIANILLDRGYYKSDDGGYRKIYVGPVIETQNWKEKKRIIKSISQISLPDMPPDYKDFNQDIELGVGMKVSLRALEDFLSAIFLLPKRDGAIVPIRKRYADAFFGHDPQLTIFPPLEARFSEYKSYFGTSNAASRLSIGKLLFFYQSQTQFNPGQVVAFARIVRSNIASRNKIEQESKRGGVLDDAGFRCLTKTAALLETVFTHSVVFPNPVLLKRLREIGCNDNANFITAYNIDYEQVRKILNEGGIL